jgi:thiol:disulfide interchange protein DsbC
MKKVKRCIPWGVWAVSLILLWCTGALADGTPMDLLKAMKIGSGKTMVIEFTDPDCPFCRKGAEIFHGRMDVTRYIFFNPLPMHPQAKDKAGYILSSSNREKAYDDAMAGRLDGRKLTGITEAGKKQLDEHMAIARDAQIDSTPTFIINGRIIQGADQQTIEAILGK